MSTTNTPAARAQIAAHLAHLEAGQVERLRVLVERLEKWDRRSAEAEERAARLERRAERLNERRLLARNELRDHLAFTMELCDRIDPYNDLAPAVVAGDKVIVLERSVDVKGGYTFTVQPLFNPPAEDPAA